jgi:hypothetical protein
MSLHFYLYIYILSFSRSIEETITIRFSKALRRSPRTVAALRGGSEHFLDGRTEILRSRIKILQE